MTRSRNADHGPFLNSREVEKRLQLCADTLRRLRNDKTHPLPALRAGHKYLYRWPEVETWLEEQGQRGREMAAAR